MLFENSVESRFRGQVNIQVGQFGHDLFGRKIPERHTVADIQDLLPFLLAQLVCRCCRRALALILTTVLLTPPDDRTGTESHDGCGVFQAIGIVRSPHTDPSKTPIQPVFAQEVKGTVILDPEYSDGLKDLEGFSHIYLFYVFHKIQETKLIVRPFLEDAAHGVFATRAPCRPNKLGFSVVKLISIDSNVLHVEDIDILDGTPIVDIKPYIARFDTRDNVRSGWQDEIADDIAALHGQRGYRKKDGLKRE